jgi:hypothetical protein
MATVYLGTACTCFLLSFRYNHGAGVIVYSGRLFVLFPRTALAGINHEMKTAIEIIEGDLVIGGGEGNTVNCVSLEDGSR